MKKVLFSGMALVTLFLASCQKRADDLRSNTIGQTSNNAQNKPRQNPPGDHGCLVRATNDNMEEWQVNEKTLYDFRDNFLYSTDEDGPFADRTEYVGDYYAISDYMIKYDMVTGANLMDCYHLLQYGVQVANTAMYGGENDIVVTDEIYDYCLAQSQKLHQSANYAEISDVVTHLETDLEALHNKTKADFIAYLQ